MKSSTRSRQSTLLSRGLSWWLRYFRIEFRRVWHSAPGQRFHARYRRVRRRKGYEEMGPRMIRLVFAGVTLGAGIACIFLPFPEAPFFILSGALLASESSGLARMLDRAELRVRDWWRAGHARWKNSSMPMKGLLAGLAVGVLAAQCYLLCRACLR